MTFTLPAVTRPVPSGADGACSEPDRPAGNYRPCRHMSRRRPVPSPPRQNRHDHPDLEDATLTDDDRAIAAVGGRIAVRVLGS
jgi:hypothetical protein